jgi:putative ABC transport system permease protein
VVEKKMNGLRNMLIFAGRGLTRRPLQTLLLLVALTVALAGTMTIMAVLSGVNAQVYRDLKRVGLDVVNVQMVPNLENLLLEPLAMEDVEWMRETAGSDRIAPFRAELAVGVNLENERSEEFLMLATTSEWGEIAPLEMLEGRFFNEREAGACVLDEWVARRFFPEDNANGKELFVEVGGGTWVFKVVGVLKDPFEIRKKFDEMDFAGAARSTMNRALEFKSMYVAGDFYDAHDAIHGAVIKAPPDGDPSGIAKSLRQEGKRRGLSTIAWARSQWVDNVMKGADFTTQIASILWIIILLVTGVMILTISLVAIRERYRELAIRRTEGARRLQVVGQLLLENLLLSGAAGLLAIGLAKLTGGLLEARYLSWPPTFLPGEMALALGLGIGIGALATIVPAFRAASLDPVQVLRTA